MMTGGYRIPPPLLTTSVMDDIMKIEEVVGIGEIAISDSRLFIYLFIYSIFVLYLSQFPFCFL